MLRLLQNMLYLQSNIVILYLGEILQHTLVCIQHLCFHYLLRVSLSQYKYSIHHRHSAFFTPLFEGSLSEFQFWLFNIKQNLGSCWISLTRQIWCKVESLSLTVLSAAPSLLTIFRNEAWVILIHTPMGLFYPFLHQLSVIYI